MENKSKKTKLIVVIVVLIITNIITFTVATTGNYLIGNKLIVTVDSSETAAGIKKLLALKEQIGLEYYKDVDNTTLIDGAIKGMFDSLGDPYSSYFTSEEFKKYMESATGVYEGIGVVVTEDDQGVTYVIAPQKGTPADQAGIKTGDKIIKVDGEDVSTIGSDAVVAKVKGPADTTVNITLLRGEEVIDMQLVRKTIEAKTVESRVIGDKGYIQISEFTDKTADDFEAQLSELLAQNITGLVIDLRSNPGGGVKEAVEIADRILGETMVVYTVDKNGNKTEYTSDGEEQLSLPMVALVDGGSASSAEILAGALQDTGAAQLVGTKTFGKGIVQEIISLTDGGGFKVTNSEYFTPNGNNIHEKGLEPNIVIEATDFMKNNFFTDEEDVQLQKALQVLSGTN
ncbi:MULTISPECIES: S41 family peptidase [Acetobacterium]|jgi:carboxyl-terminal processing protease|uniref:Carboxy-terminal processing protease CtpB n=1 Tax=Acetobacterium wieringae TaxID=52694 RepID=A0A1F2PF32_9FIRM|nr:MULTISPECIES: S41 family peptidase [Acetobacterium]OFV69967.1 carboxy-terminal processing protease CtpB precursor [Acetobacterium wieringae]TYC85899.1 S41 family peptidase [Acetobacterium wieringae]HAZ05686.1 S41 family peptidase [Acetobacterium sp.]